VVNHRRTDREAQIDLRQPAPLQLATRYLNLPLDVPSRLLFPYFEAVPTLVSHLRPPAATLNDTLLPLATQPWLIMRQRLKPLIDTFSSKPNESHSLLCLTTPSLSSALALHTNTPKPRRDTLRQRLLRDT
jgi:hypothetical protein